MLTTRQLLSNGYLHDPNQRIARKRKVFLSVKHPGLGLTYTHITIQNESQVEGFMCPQREVGVRHFFSGMLASSRKTNQQIQASTYGYGSKLSNYPTNDTIG